MGGRERIGDVEGGDRGGMGMEKEGRRVRGIG